MKNQKPAVILIIFAMLLPVLVSCIGGTEGEHPSEISESAASDNVTLGEETTVEITEETTDTEVIETTDRSVPPARQNPISVKYSEKRPENAESGHFYLKEQSEYTVYLTFSAEEAVEDIRLYLLDNSEVEYRLGEELYALDALSPDKPLVAGVVFYGDMTAYGISFKDASGAVRYFAVISNLSGVGEAVTLCEFVPVA